MPILSANLNPTLNAEELIGSKSNFNVVLADQDGRPPLSNPNNVVGFETGYETQLNSNAFRNVVNIILSNNPIDEIVETGTFLGDGSSKIFAETGKYLFTIECNPDNYKISKTNLKPYENVCVIHGLSLSREVLTRGILKEDFNLETTYDSKYPKSFYMREVQYPVMLENALDLFVNNDRKQLVFLDSAGGVGYLEFLEFMSYNRNFLKNKILMMDDINHIKHFRSVRSLVTNKYKVHISNDQRYAWCNFHDPYNQNILSTMPNLA